MPNGRGRPDISLTVFVNAKVAFDVNLIALARVNLPLRLSNVSVGAKPKPASPIFENRVNLRALRSAFEMMKHAGFTIEAAESCTGYQSKAFLADLHRWQKIMSRSTLRGSFGSCR